MNQKCGVTALEDACRRSTLNRTLEKYIKSCREDTEDGLENSPPSKKRSSLGRFPNIAGFCRYYQIGIEDIDLLSQKYPTQIDRLYAILEDEALNSGLPPAILSAYLKKRLGYDKDHTQSAASEGQMSIRFEHDIYDDGE